MVSQKPLDLASTLLDTVLTLLRDPGPGRFKILFSFTDSGKAQVSDLLNQKRPLSPATVRVSPSHLKAERRYRVGDRCTYFGIYSGVIKFVGKLPDSGSSEIHYGIELDLPKGNPDVTFPYV